MMMSAAHLRARLALAVGALALLLASGCATAASPELTTGPLAATDAPDAALAEDAPLDLSALSVEPLSASDEVAYAVASLRVAPAGLVATPDDLAVAPRALRRIVHEIEVGEDGEGTVLSDQKGVLTVRVVGLRNDTGVVRIAVYNSGNGFPKNRNAVVDSAKVKIVSGANSVEKTFDLEPGTYAVAILHDENESGSMDYNGLGMPTEGYGASLNPSASLGTPSWDDSKFELGKNKVVSIKTVYF